jgi:DNA-binding transcriptional ArsR family regulator
MPLADRTKQPEQALPFSVNHWIRIETLAILAEGQFSASEVANQLDEDVRLVTNHIHDLYDAGCIEIADYEVNGNFRKPLYRAVTLPYVSDEVYRAMSLLERHDANGVILQWFLAECFSSYRNKKMDRDENVCLIWNDPTLDAQGQIEMRDWLIRAFKGAQKIEGKSANRMAKSGEVGTKMAVGLFAFERGRSGRPKNGVFDSEKNER